MTAVLPAPVTEEITDDVPVHWACVTQWDTPFFALCGDLPRYQCRGDAPRVTCPGCLKLIAKHAAVCGACRPFAGRYP